MKAGEGKRRIHEGGDCEGFATAIRSEATLVDEPKGNEIEYRVIAVDNDEGGD